MACLGEAWDHVGSRYAGAGAAPIPAALAAAARDAHAACAAADASLPAFDAPDVCLVNFYDHGGDRMGLHRDDSEEASALERGSPVVSISLGASATFATAATRDGPRARVTLRSGDVLCFGGAARGIFHGVERVDKPKTAPPGLNMRPGRLNLTFRAVR
jgi:alkylated DNA repair protein (DNA oxidative demethylase)